MPVTSVKCPECGLVVHFAMVRKRSSLRIDVSEWHAACHHTSEASGSPHQCPALKKAIYGPQD